MIKIDTLIRSALPLAAMIFGATGCVVVSDDSVAAGDPLDARFTLTWTTTDRRTGAEVRCYAAGADTVRVQARNASTGDTLVDLFDCDSKTGETYALRAGDYHVQVDLVSCRGDAECKNPRFVSRASTQGVYEVWDDGDRDLGHFVFLVE